MNSPIKIKEWVPGSFPIPFFQTWCCSRSSVTPSADATDIWSELSSAGLPPKMYVCVRDNLVLNNVGVDCVHYLFHDAECRDFIFIGEFIYTNNNNNNTPLYFYMINV